MRPLTAAVRYSPAPFFEDVVRCLAASPLVEAVFVVGPETLDLSVRGVRLLPGESLLSHRALGAVLDGVRTPYLLLIPHAVPVSFEPDALARLVAALDSSGAGLVYPDYWEDRKGTTSLHPLIDYQAGSVRDDFDFGAVTAFSMTALRGSRQAYGLIPDVRYAGLYDLRLKVSLDHAVLRLPEALYTMAAPESRGPAPEPLFAYLDPKNEAAQKEMEQVFTDFLKKRGAYIAPERLKSLESGRIPFPVEASVVIPVLDRKGTIAQAVESALSQETDFPFNVIVVDNHSTDGTTAVLADLAARHRALRHVVPRRTDLAIGGCWNEALRHEACGRYAVQLDSDDLYQGPHTLKRLVDMLRPGQYAMVIGAYTLVDFDLREIAQGLIDHREWTDENGHNNALRVNGLGAPRAFSTALMRKAPFPNVSYGEDYAAALRIAREYRIGRIYESLYLCRRWRGNTDAALDLEAVNRNNAFKDEVRTAEIVEREHMFRAGDIEGDG